MSVPDLPSGNVFFLSGPSSTGKSTFSKSIPGAIHLEGDQFLAVTELKFIHSHRGDALSVIKQTFKNQDPTLGQIFDLIRGKMKPEVTPLNQTAFDEAKASVKSLADDRWESVQKDGSRAIDPRKSQAIWQEVFITMLDEAVKLSRLGRTVIIDTVGMMGESPEVSAPDLKPVSPSLWVYKGIEIKQFLKYAAIDRVAQNVLSRNVAGDTRTPLYVLNQYAERFKKAEEGDSVVGQCDVGKLEQWMKRFAYMKHLSIVPSTNLEKVDQSIQEGKQKLTQSQIGEIEKEIQSDLISIKEKMGLSDTDKAVSLSYRAIRSEGIYPTPIMITDVDADKTKVESGLVPTLFLKGESVTPVHLEKRMEQYNVPAVSVAVIDHGKVVWAAGYGTACTTETRFQTASIGKPVTAMAIMKLVEEGKVNLDEDVNIYLTSWKLEGTKPGEKVTLRMLLSHTAGVNVGGFAGFSPNEALPPSTVDLLNGKHSSGGGEKIQVVQIPGSKWNYSGGGYLVLQQVIEDVVNKDKALSEKETFAQIIERMVFKPLGMVESSYSVPAAKAAAGHDQEGKPISGNYHLYPEQAAAGFWTTASDLAKILIEVQLSFKGEGKILGPQTTREMLTPQSGTEFSGGLGLGVKEMGDVTYFNHGGHNAGYHTMMVGFAGSGQGAIVMTNGENGEFLHRELIGSIAKAYNWGFRKPEPLVTTDANPATFGQYTGTYIVEGTNPVQQINISLRDGKLYSQNPVLPFECRLYPIGENQFKMVESDETYSFVLTRDEVVGLKSNLATNHTITKQRI